jgi:putative ABC transport system substrate-binding protein
LQPPVTLIGRAAAWPLVANDQQPDRMRRVGVLMALAQGEPEAQVRAKALEVGLREFGWVSAAQESG